MMEDNPFGVFTTTSTEASTDSTYNPHIDPNLQQGLTSSYASSHLDANGQHAIPFYPPLAQAANPPLPFSSLRNGQHDVQQITTPTTSRSKPRAITQTPQTPQLPGGGQFGVLRLSYPETPFQRLQQDAADAGRARGSTDGKKEPAHFQGMKKVVDPPNLAEWRDKLFNVNEVIYLTEDE